MLLRLSSLRSVSVALKVQVAALEAVGGKVLGRDEVVQPADVAPHHADVVVGVDLQQHARRWLAVTGIVLDRVGMSEHAVDRRLGVRLERFVVGTSLLVG